MHLFSLQVCKKWLNLFQKISEADSFRGSSTAEKFKRFLTQLINTNRLLRICD